MRNPEILEQAPQFELEEKPVPLSHRINSFKDRCRWLTLISMVAYMTVKLLMVTYELAQRRATFMIFENQAPVSQIRSLLNYDQAWKVTLGTTIFLGIITLPRWQSFLALFVVVFGELVLGPILAM